jgi:hypothetical protein
MKLTHQQTQTLNKLSKEIFGKSSFWKNQIVNKGLAIGNGKRRYLHTYEEVVAELEKVKKSIKGITAKSRDEFTLVR